MTSPNTAEPTPWPEPSQTPSSPPAAAAGTGNRLAWLDVLRGLAHALDARLGPDRFPVRTRAPEPALAHGSGRAE